ncbi:MAG: cobalamin B12-binding domain-containing protein [Rhodospirillaceae bacterium]|nr:cobalamin B12-binding domain-containing protein [Rhodospirillaceae bacterium]
MDRDGGMDLVLLNPGGREAVYQDLGASLSAVEPPLWCRLIAGHVRDRGLSVAILDSEAEQWGPERAAAEVAALHPRLVAVVVFGHQPSASTQSMVGARAACRAMKAAGIGAPLLIVGGHVSALPERTLREEPVDFACMGEGPATVMGLLAALEDLDRHGDDEAAQSAELGLAGVPGLVWWRDGAVVVNPSAPLIADLDQDLHGDVWDLLPMDRYRAHNWHCFGAPEMRQPYASIHTSLGCPYTCTFCCINAPFGTNRYRMRRPSAVVDEIRKLHDHYGVRAIKIIDEMFILNERHVREICEGIVAAQLDDLNIWAYARVDTVRPDMLPLLRSAGFRWLALGIEAGSARVRDGVGKGVGQDDILATVRAIQKAGIAVLGNFIFGLPGDDLDSMARTLDLARDLNCEFVNFYSAMAYPGSRLFEQAGRDGVALPDSWSGYAQHSRDCLPLATGKVDGATVLRFRDDAFHAYFEGKRYLDMLTQRFGWEARSAVEAMTKTRLRRDLLAQAPVAP